MPLYGGIDLHANNSVVVLLNEQDQVIYQKRLPNDLPTILEPLAPYHAEIEGVGGGIDLQLVLARRWLDGGGLSRASGQSRRDSAV